MESDVSVKEVLERLETSKKYRHLHRDTLARVARRAAKSCTSTVDAIKLARRKLHQMHSAFVRPRELARVEYLVRSIRKRMTEDQLKAVCREILYLHSSTRERMLYLEQFYGEVFRITGVPNQLLDVGCGFHPFAIPWMNLPKKTNYIAWDVDTRLMPLIQEFFKSIGQKGQAECKDLVGSAALPAVDALFLLKMLPTLERQDGNTGRELLRAIPARFLVISFPTRALSSAKSKGMKKHYRERMTEILRIEQWPATELTIGSELVFVVDKQSKNGEL